MTYVSKNWGFFVIFSGIMAALAVAAVFLIIWISTVFSVIWLYFLWRFSTIKYQMNDTELEIRSGIFVKAVRRVSLREILWKSHISVGSAVITVLHTAAGSVFLFADF
ncbi:MAG: hypothetical protein K2N06_01815 [Oscillospiraceae bacterium]|nr:hypothetical protein [Oscillospiraceae bacterium]